MLWVCMHFQICIAQADCDWHVPRTPRYQPPAALPANQHQHPQQDWVRKIFRSFVTRTFDCVIAGPTVLCCTLPYTTCDPAVATTSPPIRSDSLQSPRRPMTSFFFLPFFFF